MWGSPRPHQVISMGIKQDDRVARDSKLNQIVNKHWDEGTLVGQFQLLMKFLRRFTNSR